MADVFSKEKRSEIMSRIRAKNTGIERMVFSHLRKNKIHFQRHYSKVPGKPDVAVPSRKIAVFIDGDFWHGYKFESWKHRIPQEYWKDKITGNIVRDAKNRRALRKKGWRVMRVWSHQLAKAPDRMLKQIADFLIK